MIKDNEEILYVVNSGYTPLAFSTSLWVTKRLNGSDRVCLTL